MITKRLFNLSLQKIGQSNFYCVKALNEHIEYVKLSDVDYEKCAECTLTKLADYFDSLPDFLNVSQDFDVTYSMGVLTANFGSTGTYVINKQSPNKQLWLSSPISGPKRYDMSKSGKWIYKYDGISLNETLQNELRKIFTTNKINLPV